MEKDFAPATARMAAMTVRLRKAVNKHLDSASRFLDASLYREAEKEMAACEGLYEAQEIVLQVWKDYPVSEE